jgi:hypothetical protein
MNRKDITPNESEKSLPNDDFPPFTDFSLELFSVTFPSSQTLFFVFGPCSSLQDKNQISDLWSNYRFRLWAVFGKFAVVSSPVFAFGPCVISRPTI